LIFAKIIIIFAKIIKIREGANKKMRKSHIEKSAALVYRPSFCK